MIPVPPDIAARGARRPFRVAAVLLLAGGIAYGLWRDPAILDDWSYRLPLIAGFAAVWMVPELRALHGWRRQPAGLGGWARTLIGAAVGVVIGTVLIAASGAESGLPDLATLLERLWNMAHGAGLVVACAVSAFLVAAIGVFVSLLMRGIRASRVVGGMVIGLFLSPLAAPGLMVLWQRYGSAAGATP